MLSGTILPACTIAESRPTFTHSARNTLLSACLLAGVSPADGPTFAAAALLALLVALAASVLPVRRAVRIDPLAAIRAE